MHKFDIPPHSLEKKNSSECLWETASGISVLQLSWSFGVVGDDPPP